MLLADGQEYVLELSVCVLLADGQEYVLELSVLQRTEVYYGNDWESRIVERMCRYKLNGVDGWGFSEFQYRYVYM